jgi:hypothetical protein
LKNASGGSIGRIPLMVALKDRARWLADDIQKDIQYWEQTFGLTRKESVKLVSTYNAIGGKANYESEDLYEYAKIKLEKDKNLEVTDDEALTILDLMFLPDETKAEYKRFISTGLDTTKTIFRRSQYTGSEDAFTYDWDEDGKGRTEGGRHDAYENYLSEATKQSAWRHSVLSKDDVIRLHRVQSKWQQEEQWYHEERDKIARNEFLNKITKGPPPVQMKTPFPIERGMRIPVNEFDDFINQFSVGKNVKMPPSGFSSRLTLARGYSRNGGPESGSVGVLIRLLPKDGMVYGLTLGRAYEAAPPDVLGHPLTPTDKYTLDGEPEIIRPSWANNEILEINKIIAASDNPAEPPAPQVADRGAGSIQTANVQNTRCQARRVSCAARLSGAGAPHTRF